MNRDVIFSCRLIVSMSTKAIPVPVHTSNLNYILEFLELNSA